MGRFFAFFLACLAVLTVGCTPAKYGGTSYAYTRHEAPRFAPLETRRVFIDAKFPDLQRGQIVAAVSQWETALNGYEHFVIEAKPFVAAADADRVTIFDFVFLDVTPEEADAPGVLGWMDDLGDPVVHLVGPSLVDQDMRPVAMHEMGHSLGLKHSDVAGSLMFPTYPQNSLPCVDEVTVRALASARPDAYSAEHMNWCTF